jgi:hypothetical protein
MVWREYDERQARRVGKELLIVGFWTDWGFTSFAIA